MKFIMLSIPFLLFSLMSGASDAQSQIENVRDAVTPAVSGTRGIASDEEEPVTTEAGASEINRNGYFTNQNVTLASGTETAYYPPSQPVRAKKKATPAATNEGVGTGE